MAENDQLTTPDAAHSGNRASRIVPIGFLCALALALVINNVRGKSDQTLAGVVVMDYPSYRFYPDLKDCHIKGTPYWLMPNHRFHDVVPMPSTSDIDHLDLALHAAWRVRLHGNLSPIGRYGFQAKYWREFDVLYVIDAMQLDCKDEDIKTTP